MKNQFPLHRSARWSGSILAGCSLLMMGLAAHSTQAAAPPRAAAPQVVTAFQDVPGGSAFATYINNLYFAGIVGGYACGGTNPTTGTAEPCVGPENLPYYRPSSNVTRQQMAKFADLGRRNIADAIGNSLYISTTAAIALDAETRSGGEGVYAACMQANNNCYALQGVAPAGDYAGYIYGGRGVYASSGDDSYAALGAISYGNSAYGVTGESYSYRGGYIKSDSNAYYSLYVDDVDGPSQITAALDVRGTARVEGNLVVAGSKTGYVVDAMQNVGTEILQPGDVVTIVGNGASVLGKIPVVQIKKATSAYDTGVVGVVDQVLYVPDAATKAAYDAQEATLRAAQVARNKADAAAHAQGPHAKPDYSQIQMPTTHISDADGVMHAIEGATEVTPNGYANVVTLGSYQAIKVDASFGPIKAGDLLTSSTHAGYAMKVTDRALANGAVIGKALANLPSGTGTIPVMVTLK